MIFFVVRTKIGNPFTVVCLPLNGQSKKSVQYPTALELYDTDVQGFIPEKSTEIDFDELLMR